MQSDWRNRDLCGGVLASDGGGSAVPAGAPQAPPEALVWAGLSQHVMYMFPLLYGLPVKQDIDSKIAVLSHPPLHGLCAFTCNGYRVPLFRLLR